MFYERLNQLITEIENHLEGKINYQKLAQKAGLSLPTLQKIFPLVTGIGLADYVRNRRLTLAGKDLAQSNLRVIDVATKYNYNSDIAFSRAFYKFHGIKPSEVNRDAERLKYFPKLVFTVPEKATSLDYEIIQTPVLNLAGLKVESNHQNIHRDAPALFTQIEQQYPELSHPEYGLLDYQLGRDEVEKYQYYVLWPAEKVSAYSEFAPYHIPAMRWLKFSVVNQNATDIQALMDRFYEEFLPTCGYQLRPEPDLEHYHDGKTDLLIPIY